MPPNIALEPTAQLTRKRRGSARALGVYAAQRARFLDLDDWIEEYKLCQTKGRVCRNGS